MQSRCPKEARSYEQQRVTKNDASGEKMLQMPTKKAAPPPTHCSEKQILQHIVAAAPSGKIMYCNCKVNMPCEVSLRTGECKNAKHAADCNAM